MRDQKKITHKKKDYNIESLTPNNEVFDIKFGKMLVISVKLAENLLFYQPTISDTFYT